MIIIEEKLSSLGSASNQWKKGTKKKPAVAVNKSLDQNHTKTICWECDSFVMVFSEKNSRKPSLLIKTIQWFVKGSGFKNQNF